MVAQQQLALHDRPLFHPAAHRAWLEVGQASRLKLMSLFQRISTTPPGQHSTMGVKALTAGHSLRGPAPLAVSVRVNKRDTRVIFAWHQGDILVLDVEDGYTEKRTKGASNDRIARAMRRRDDIVAPGSSVCAIAGEPYPSTFGLAFGNACQEARERVVAVAPEPPAEPPAPQAPPKSQYDNIFVELVSFPQLGHVHAVAHALRVLVLLDKPCSCDELSEAMAPNRISEHSISPLIVMGLVDHVGTKYAHTALGAALAEKEPTRIARQPDGRIGWCRDMREDPFTTTYRGPVAQRDIALRALRAATAKNPNGVGTREAWDFVPPEDRRFIEFECFTAQTSSLASEGAVARIKHGNKNFFYPDRPTAAPVAVKPPVPVEAPVEAPVETPAEPKPVVISAAAEDPRGAIVRDAQAFCDTLGAELYAALSKDERHAALKLLDAVEDFIALLK